ncbi:MAG: hypothetical protein KatS3mg110_0326 [Pirellulaceae bacterium]|nr:MAG: hypothetical protein KatS3mg110_0326 [Pirellulaceae bacterium]
MEPRDALEWQLQRIWEDVLDRRPISITDNFFDVGGDSLSAMTLLARIAHETGLTLPPAGIMQAPTIEQLANVLRGGLAQTDWNPVVPLSPTGTAPPLFLVHPLGGSVLCYMRLVQRLQKTRPIYGLQSRGIDGRDEPSERIEQMAGEYVQAMRRVRPRGPYLLAGWSLGGIIAYEMAVQLQEQGDDVSLLAMFDAGHLYAFAVMLTFFKQDSQDMWSRLAAPEDEQIAFFREKTARAQLIPPQADQQTARNIYRVVVANMRALYQYHPRPYRGKVVLFRAREKYIESRHDPAEEWKRLATEVEVIPTGGDHLSLVHEPFVDELAGHLQRVLDRLPTES